MNPPIVTAAHASRQARGRIFVISDDVEELLVSSRVLIMREGRISAELADRPEEHIVRAIEGL